MRSRYCRIELTLIGAAANEKRWRGPLEEASPSTLERLEVDRRREEHLPRVAVICGQHAGLAKRRDRVAGGIQDEIARVRVLSEEIVSSRRCTSC